MSGWEGEDARGAGGRRTQKAELVLKKVRANQFDLYIEALWGPLTDHENKSNFSERTAASIAAGTL